MFRILITDKLGDAGLRRLEEAEDAAYEMNTDLSREELLETIPDYDALIVRSGTKVDAGVLEAGERLQVVGRAGIGVDNIDVRAATRRGIVVMNTPQANAVATAEQTMTLMLALSRHTAPAHASLKAGEWRRSDFVGVELYDKILGIIGFGRIGRLVAQRAQAFGMDVLAYDPYVPEDVGQENGVSLLPLDELLPQADYVTLHSVVTPETEKIINPGTIAQMKEGVRLVNVARGKLIDEQALADALHNGTVAGAAVDVYSQEPPQDNPLLQAPNVLHTPHLGASTIEAQRAVATEIVAQVLDALRGGGVRNALNMPFPTGPEVAAARPYMELGEKMGALLDALAPNSIRQVEVTVEGDRADDLVRPVAAAVLKGVLKGSLSVPVNDVNVHLLAEERDITVSQTSGPAPADYPTLVSSRGRWEGGQHTLTGALFGDGRPRIVQIDDAQVNASPEGAVLIIRSDDTPDVLGQVGTVFAAYDVGVAAWHMEREEPGKEAFSFVNLDGTPPEGLLQALEKIPAVTALKVVTL